MLSVLWHRSWERKNRDEEWKRSYGAISQNCPQAGNFIRYETRAPAGEKERRQTLYLRFFCWTVSLNKLANCSDLKHKAAVMELTCWRRSEVLRIADASESSSKLQSPTGDSKRDPTPTYRENQHLALFS